MTAEELVGLNRKERLRAEIESIDLRDHMSREYPYVGPDDTVSEVLSKMRDFDLHEVPVLGDGRDMAGVVSYGTLLKRKGLAASTKAGTLAIDPPEIAPDTTVTKVAEAFIFTGFRQLPVVEGRRMVGMVSRTDLLKIVKMMKDIGEIPIEYIMSPQVQSVTEDDRVIDAIILMRNLDIRVLPALDGMGRLSGIMGIKDIADYNWKEKRRQTVGEMAGDKIPVEVTVKSVMNRSPVTASPSSPLRDAARIMIDRNISTLPIVRDGALAGIATKYDIVELLASFRQRSMMYMQITGLEPEERFVLDQMEKEITATMQKIARITPPLMLTVHVSRINAEGLNYLYTLNGRLTTDREVMVGNAEDWNLIKATQSLMRSFERRLVENKERRLDHRRRSKNIGHS